MAKKIKIIMQSDILNLGEEGDVCEVALGYARNYLFPKKYAVPYNKHNLTILNQRRRAIEKKKAEKRLNAQELKQKIENEVLIFKMPAGENGKLFGSITNGLVAEELQKKGYALEKKRIELPEHHIKLVGNYTATIKLYENEQASLKIIIEPIVEEKTSKDVKPEKGQRPGRMKSEAKEATQQEPKTSGEGSDSAAPT